MKKIVVILSVFSLIACGSSKNVEANKFELEKLSSLSAQEISKNFGAANIKEGEGLYDEGTEKRAYTILYPETSDELHITWTDASKKQIKDISFSNAGKWRTKEGIKVGTSYVELNKLNGKEISFYGFGWDYSGAVVWNNGKLERTKLRVFLAPENEPKARFIGDQIIKATPEEIAKMNLKVASIILVNSDK